MKSIRTLICLSGLAAALIVPAFAQDTPTDPGSTEPEFVGPPVRERGGLLQGIRDRIDLPEDLTAAIDDYQATQATLRQQLREELATLEDPTREQIQEATQAFQEANADLIASQRELAQSIRDEVQMIRMENAPDRPEVPEAVQQARQQFREQRQTMVQARQQLRQQLAAAETREERLQIMNTFREQQRENVQEMRELRRTLRNELREGRGGNGSGGNG